MAVIADGLLAWARGWGVRDAGSADPVTETTLFQAASIGKAVAALAVVLLLASWLPSPAAAIQARAGAHVAYTCRKYGYAFQVPSGWRPAKPDTRRCVADPQSPLETSSPQFNSPSGRAYVQIWAGPRIAFDGKGWVTSWMALLHLPTKLRPTTWVAHGTTYYGVKAATLAMDDNGVSFHIFLVVAATTHAANTYGFFGLVGLDHNSHATGESSAVNQSLTSFHFLP
jgi:hypothetical protein